MPSIRPADEQDVAQLVQDNAKAAVTNALPGVIRSFDPETVTCDVDIAITARMTKAGTMVEDFQYESVRYPILEDLPVVFPRGGGVTLTFPIKEGDECLIVFSSRSIDFWWQSGGVQERADGRVLDLSDAFVIPGPQSQAHKISGINTGAAQLRSDDGSTFFELNPSTKKIKIVAPGGVEVVTPLADFSEKVTIHGLLSWMGGMVGSVASGVASKITGAVEFIGTVKANGKSIDNTHTHGGVQRGGSNTNEVN